MLNCPCCNTHACNACIGFSHMWSFLNHGTDCVLYTFCYEDSQRHKSISQHLLHCTNADLDCITDAGYPMKSQQFPLPASNEQTPSLRCHFSRHPNDNSCSVHSSHSVSWTLGVLNVSASDSIQHILWTFLFHIFGCPTRFLFRTLTPK